MYDAFMRKMLSKTLLQATTFKTNLLRPCGSPDLIIKAILMDFLILKSSLKNSSGYCKTL